MHDTESSNDTPRLLRKSFQDVPRQPLESQEERSHGQGSVPAEPWWRAAGLLHEEQASGPARLGSAVIALISLAGIS